MGKGRLTKFFTILLTMMLVVGMTPITQTTAYAASRTNSSIKTSITSWLSNLTKKSENDNSAEDKTQANGLNILESSTSDDSGTVNDINLTKTAEANGQDDEGNPLFNITLGVQGKEVTKGAPVDFTLVVDLSNSMTNSGSQSLAITKNAAKEFINTVLADGNDNIRVSIVAYGTMGHAYNFTNKSWDLYGSTKSSGYYTSSRTDATNIIDSSSFAPSKLSPTSGNGYTEYESGGTNTEGGFLTAKAVTETRNNPDAASIVVFMTDGVPTYHYSTGTTVAGGGSSTTEEDFNEAVEAGKELKAAGNTIYTVGLLTGYNNNSYQMTMANNLLSDSASYNLSISRYGQTNYSYTNIGSAYSQKYYPITDGSKAAEQIKEIYTSIAKESLVLATGTVVDYIPEGFEVVESSLEACGGILGTDADGRQTVTFTGVKAGKDVTTLTLTVKYTGDKYGVAYTNTKATYSGKLYDGTDFSKDFPLPVVGLNPQTGDDEYYLDPNTNSSLDIWANDKLEVINDDNYTISDLQITLSNVPEGVTATAQKNDEGKWEVVFNGPVGDYEFDYVLTATATKTQSSEGIPATQYGWNTEKTTFTISSRDTNVKVHIVAAANQAFVVDFGKPVTYDATKVFTDSELKSTITLPNGTGTYGNMSLNNDKSITYTLKKFMSGIDMFVFNEKYTDEKSLEKTISMIPGTSIYYEDNFEIENEDGTKSTAITYDSNWIVLDKDNIKGDSIQEVLGDGETGYDTNYNKDDSKLSYSSGSIHVVQAPSDSTAKASFEFTGTGVDIYSLTSGQTGKIQVAVWKQNTDGTYPKTAIYRKTIDTKYNSGTAYQLPVVNFEGDNTPATYKVQITVGKGQTFYLDAIRIYNPIGNVSGYYGEESGVNYVSIREQSLNPSVFTVTGDVFIDAYLESVAKSVTLSDSTSDEVINEYTNYGRKTEVVIAPGKTVTLKLTNASSFLELGARIDAAAPSTVAGGSSDGKVTVNGKPINVNSSTDMYYTISADTNNNIEITNNTDKLIAITNLKLK